MDKNIPRNLIISLLLLIAVFTIGVGGYMIIEKWDFFDSLYMTVITMATVGYGETHPLSSHGRILTIFLILVGMGILVYSVSAWIAFLIEGYLGGMFKKRKMEKQIKNLKGHYIICASNEMGMYVIEEFYKTKKPYVVISRDSQHVIPRIKERGDILYIENDPSEDKVLMSANICEAEGLISALSDDKENLFVVLAARQLNPQIKIVAEGIDRTVVAKLLKAGADKVVSAMEIGGMRIASQLIRPAVVDFLDSMLYSSDKPLRVEQQVIPEKSGLIGKTLHESDIHKKTGALLVAIKQAQPEQYLFNPQQDYRFQPNDTLIVIGDVEQVRKLRELGR